MKISTLALCSIAVLTLTVSNSPVWVSPVWAAPKADGTQRQTAQPWTGSAESFETPGRANKLQLPKVYRDLGIKQGSVVADIGAGGGWLTVRLGLEVGPKGVVYAEDILPKYTNYIDRRAKATGLSNVRTILGSVTDPKLPAKTLDAALILNAYHEFDEPVSMLVKIRAAMKPGGRIGILERDTDWLRLEARNAYARTGKILRRVNEKNDNNQYTDDHQLALNIVQREGLKAGWKYVGSRELGDDNYLAVFVAP